MKKQDNAIIGIYKITSPSGKIYIGQSVNIERRFNEYLNLFNCKQQTKLYNSLKKYGSKNHIFEILEECSLKQLDEKEVYLGKEFNVLKNGLNCRLGKGKGALSQETKDKMSKARLGNKYNLGKKKSQEVKNTISEALSIPIIQFDLNGDKIKRYNSIKSAAEINNLDEGTLCSCLKGRQKTCGKFKWKYE